MNNRIEKLIPLIPQEADGVLITSEHNRYYFTGLRATDGTLLVTRDGSYAIIDFRYIEVARRTIKNCQVILQDDLKAQLAQLVKKHDIHALAVETSYLTIGEMGRYAKLMPGVELLSSDVADAAILKLRSIKDQEELGYIKAAQDIADQSFTNILNVIRPGLTEKQVAVELEYFMRKAGAEKPSFDTICVSGVNSSLPHGVPTDKPLAAGEFLTMDFGAMVEGYCSDMTRTVVVGHATEEMQKVYSTVLAAQLAAIQKAAVGVPCIQVDAAARDLIYAAGYEGCFGHGTGHSVGLEIHEEPRFSLKTQATCCPGIVMTVEPGIYLEGKFGCRIEDMIFITEKGVENLAHSPKELIVV